MAEASVEGRAKAAVLGALVADAATMGLHWIYDTNKLNSLLAAANKIDEPEFFAPPSCPFYQYPSGQLSPYGYEAHGVLALLAGRPDLDPPAFARGLADWFAAYSGRRNHTWGVLVDNLTAGKQFPHCGADDAQADNLVKVPALVARYSGLPELAARVEAAVRAHQDNALAVDTALAAAAILDRVVQGASVAEAVQWAASATEVTASVREQAAEAQRLAALPFAEVVAKVGASCALPGAFTAGLACALAAPGYAAGVRANMAAGGDNCSRAALAGALLAAAGGLAAMPAGWRQQTTEYVVLEALAEQLVRRRG